MLGGFNKQMKTVIRQTRHAWPSEGLMD